MFGNKETQESIKRLESKISEAQFRIDSLERRFEQSRERERDNSRKLYALEKYLNIEYDNYSGAQYIKAKKDCFLF